MKLSAVETKEWVRRHLAPVVATSMLLVFGMDYVISWLSVTKGETHVWLAPSDLWGTYFSAVSLSHGHLTWLYAEYPGFLALLAPIAALGFALHLSVGPNFSAVTAPTAWILVGPFILLLTSVPIFALDAIADRFGVDRRRRVALATVEAFLLANVAIKWGHPEDALAFGLVLFAALAVDANRNRRAGWLIGAAVAVQPLALLALPAILTFVVMRSGRRSALGLLSRAVVPGAVLLVPALVVDWSQLSGWLIHQPNYIGFNHSTPWTTFAPRLRYLGFDAVAAGPSRTAGIVLAVVSGVVLCRRDASLRRLVLALAVAFLIRVASESVLDAYYIWPVLALVVLSSSKRRAPIFWATVALSITATWFANSSLLGADPWWILLMSLIAALMVLGFGGPQASVATTSAVAGEQTVHGLGGRFAFPRSVVRHRQWRRDHFVGPTGH